MTKTPRERAREVLAVVVEDPDVDATETDEVLQASLELANDLHMRRETGEEIQRLAKTATFVNANEWNVGERIKDGPAVDGPTQP